MIDLHVVEATPADAAEVVDVVHTAFRARPPLDPPGTALAETEETVRAALERHGGLLACVDGVPAGAMLFVEDDGWLGLRRVSVAPRFQRRGVATAMVGCAEDAATERGSVGVRLQARVELPETVEFWQRRGYALTGRTGPDLFFAKVLPIGLRVPSAAAMRDLGSRLASTLRAGDLVILAGDLGAGKTTLVQGIGAGLGVRGDVTSPTFVIARVHPAEGAGPPLVHVDAYRLGGIGELDDLDLDASVEESVTVVEWGGGLAEGLAADRLEIELTRGRGDADAYGDADAGGGVGEHGDAAVESADRDEPRGVRIVAVGPRWADGVVHRLLV